MSPGRGRVEAGRVRGEHCESVTKAPVQSRHGRCKIMSSGRGEVLSSLRGKVLELPERKKSSYSRDTEEWTPYNGDMHMQGIKVPVSFTLLLGRVGYLKTQVPRLAISLVHIKI